MAKQSGHSHAHATPEVSDSVLLWAVVVNFGLSVFEFIAGVISGSVALMADALHNTNDAGALLIAYMARRISRKGADKKFTFGYRRAELIGAMIQLTALIVVGLYLIYEAVHRLFDPQPLLGAWIMGAAGIALVVDLVTAWLLWAMSKGSLNVRAAFLHNLTDAGASIAVLFGGAAIFWLDWHWVDPVLTLLIAGYILYLSFNMLKRTAGILMEGTPKDLDLEALQKSVEACDGVVGLHHIHVWELDERHRALEAHLVIADGSLHQQDAIKQAVKSRLQDEFDIGHSTLEFETASQACSGAHRQMIPGHD
ncbi:MAG: cation diffusion facilitator family transporter [Opitutales bacterium]